jgi:hypothetical protein
MKKPNIKLKRIVTDDDKRRAMIDPLDPRCVVDADYLAWLAGWREFGGRIVFLPNDHGSVTRIYEFVAPEPLSETHWYVRID